MVEVIEKSKEASEFHAGRLNAKEVLKLLRDGNFSKPSEENPTRDYAKAKNDF